MEIGTSLQAEQGIEPWRWKQLKTRRSADRYRDADRVDEDALFRESLVLPETGACATSWSSATWASQISPVAPHGVGLSDDDTLRKVAMVRLVKAVYCFDPDHDAAPRRSLAG